jgi:hypothetical protein
MVEDNNNEQSQITFASGFKGITDIEEYAETRRDSILLKYHQMYNRISENRKRAVFAAPWSVI